MNIEKYTICSAAILLEYYDNKTSHSLKTATMIFCGLDQRMIR